MEQQPWCANFSVEVSSNNSKLAVAILQYGINHFMLRERLCEAVSRLVGT